MSQSDRWDRCTLGGIELPGFVELMNLHRRQILDEWKRHAACFSFLLPARCIVELITPNGDDIARWEGEGGAP